MYIYWVLSLTSQLVESFLIFQIRGHLSFLPNNDPLIILFYFSPYRFSWEVKETPYVQEVYGQTYGEDNAYERTYTHAQAEVAYIDVDWRFRSCSLFRFRFRRTRYFCFRCRFRRTRYCPVRTNSHTQVVWLRNIDRLDRLCQAGVISCKWTRKLTSVQ